MEINELISSKDIIVNLKSTSKKQALQALARHAEIVFEENSRMIFDVLMEREKLGTTGVGNGIAIPHGKLSKIKKPHGIFARLQNPVDFQAIDNQPVDLIFVLFAPTAAGADHLKALARISRLLRDKSICEKLRGTETVDGLYAILTESSGSEAS